jgi:hypothetical protein
VRWCRRELWGVRGCLPCGRVRVVDHCAMRVGVCLGLDSRLICLGCDGRFSPRQRRASLPTQPQRKHGHLRSCHDRGCGDARHIQTLRDLRVGGRRALDTFQWPISVRHCASCRPTKSPRLLPLLSSLSFGVCRVPARLVSPKVFCYGSVRSPRAHPTQWRGVCRRHI